MIERGAERGGAAAGPQVEAVRGDVVRERVMREGAHVSGLPRPFESMHQDQFGNWIRGALGVNQNLHIGLGPVQPGVFGKVREIKVSRPEISEDREYVRIPD
jgi:hypothetical protein